MRPAFSVRYASTPRSPSRLRVSAHAPRFKTKQIASTTTEVTLTSAAITIKADTELAPLLKASKGKEQAA